jgi:hypothetical protein
MQTNAQAMHALLALANTNLAAFIDTGDTNALLVGTSAAHGLVAHGSYANLANHDVLQPYSPAKPAWLRLSALVQLACSGATAVPDGAAIEALPGAASCQQGTFAQHLALQVEELDDLPWLCSVRGSANGQAKPGQL